MRAFNFYRSNISTAQNKPVQKSAAVKLEAIVSETPAALFPTFQVLLQENRPKSRCCPGIFTRCEVHMSAQSKLPNWLRSKGVIPARALREQKGIKAWSCQQQICVQFFQEKNKRPDRRSMVPQPRGYCVSRRSRCGSPAVLDCKTEVDQLSPRGSCLQLHTKIQCTLLYDR